VREGFRKTYAEVKTAWPSPGKPEAGLAGAPAGRERK
jgi:hypothetical protein